MKLERSEPAGHLQADGAEADINQAFPALDWLRMALGIMVALSHLGVSLPEPLGGSFAVEVFFALSGWLIGRILVRSNKIDMPRFFYNRTTRIWFPYVFAIFILYGFALFREGLSLNWAKYLFYDVTFTHFNFVKFPRAASEMPLGGSGNQFWSLAVEEQFYLLAPIFMLFFYRGKQLIPWVIIGIVAMTLQSVAAPLVIGVIGALLQRDYGDWHLGGLARIIVIVATVALGVAAHFIDIPSLRALFASAIVLSLAFPGRRGSFGMFIGGLSYPFYLNHWIGGYLANGLAKHVALPSAVHIILALAISIIVSATAWALIDRPLLRYRAAWFSRVWGKRAGIIAYLTVLVGLAGGLAIERLGG